MLIRMCLARIVIVDSEEEKLSMIVLRELAGEHRAFPIMIGIHEAYAIDRRTKHHKMERPLTHDLIANIFDELGYKLERIVINELRESTFHAKLVLQHNGQTLEVDSRPSDAIAIGAGTETPIYVDESVLDEVCRS